MFELRLVQGGLLKKVVESIKDLVDDANFDCSSTGLSLKAMDSCEDAFVELLLRSEGFEHYRCDSGYLTLGMNMGKLAKELKRAGDDDIITIRADDGVYGTVTFIFENPAAARAHPVFLLGQHNIAGFEMKLMDIEREFLGIPKIKYQATVRMPSSQFARICKYLSSIGGDKVVISVTKEGVEFSTRCGIGTARIVYRQNNTTVDHHHEPEEENVLIEINQTARIVCRQNPIDDHHDPEEESEEEEGESVLIKMKEPVSMTFALRYLNAFTKATPLSSTVTIYLLADIPAVVEYKIAEMGHLRFCLAPEK